MTTLRETPDERLELSAIPLRIEKVKLMPWSKGKQKRLDALYTRLGTPPSGSTRAEKKAFVSPLPAREFNGAVQLSTAVNFMPSNVFAGLLANKSQVASGYGRAAV